MFISGNCIVVTEIENEIISANCECNEEET